MGIDWENVAKPIGGHTCAYGCWDWSKGSLAVIASDGERSLLIDHIGGPLDYWIGEVGLDAALEQLEGMAAGVWYCEVRIDSHQDYFGEYDEELTVVKTRTLTEDEWELVRDGDSPWDDSGWHCCEDANEAKSDD